MPQFSIPLLGADQFGPIKSQNLESNFADWINYRIELNTRGVRFKSQRNSSVQQWDCSKAVRNSSSESWRVQNESLSWLKELRLGAESSFWKSRWSATGSEGHLLELGSWVVGERMWCSRWLWTAFGSSRGIWGCLSQNSDLGPKWRILCRSQPFFPFPHLVSAILESALKATQIGTAATATAWRS